MTAIDINSEQHLSYCGHEMELWKIWHPNYGVIYDECVNLKAGKYDPEPEQQGRKRCSVWPPPEEYSYCCSQCRHEMKVNEVIIDFQIGMAEFAGTYYEGSMPIVGCPNCNQETMEYVKA